MKPFTVICCKKVFDLLRELTPLMILRTRIIPRINPAFRENVDANGALIEFWSLGGLLLSLAFFVVCLTVGRGWWQTAKVVGWILSVEIVIVQINVL